MSPSSSPTNPSEAVERIREFEAGLLDFFRTRHPAILEHIRTEGTLPDRDALVAAIEDFKSGFLGEG